MFSVGRCGFGYPAIDGILVVDGLTRRIKKLSGKGWRVRDKCGGFVEEDEHTMNTLISLWCRISFKCSMLKEEEEEAEEVGLCVNHRGEQWSMRSIERQDA